MSARPNRRMIVALASLLLPIAQGARSAGDDPLARRSAEAEADVRALIARWYEESRKRREGRRYLLVGPGGIVDRQPPCETGEMLPAVLDMDTRFSHELTWRALEFAYEIRDVRIDPNFARVEVHERGWMYASDPQTTYRNDAAALFLLERDDHGAWKIMAHQVDGTAVPPGDRDDPMPDLSDAYDESIGQEPPPR